MIFLLDRFHNKNSKLFLALRNSDFSIIINEISNWKNLKLTFNWNWRTKTFLI